MKQEYQFIFDKLFWGGARLELRHVVALYRLARINGVEDVAVAVIAAALQDAGQGGHGGLDSAPPVDQKLLDIVKALGYAADYQPHAPAHWGIVREWRAERVRQRQYNMPFMLAEEDTVKSLEPNDLTDVELRVSGLLRSLS